MFGFDRDEDGSQVRHHNRVASINRASGVFPRVRHYGWWLVHNCVSHPLIGALPLKPLFDFHDWTSRRMHPPTPPDDDGLRAMAEMSSPNGHDAAEFLADGEDTNLVANATARLKEADAERAALEGHVRKMLDEVSARPRIPIVPSWPLSVEARAHMRGVTEDEVRDEDRTRRGENRRP